MMLPRNPQPEGLMNSPLSPDFLATLQSALTRRWFFVCGAQKSGTTWLQRILDAHPQVQCRGEGHFFTELSRLLGQSFTSYNKTLGKVAEQVYEGRPYYPGVRQRDYHDVLITVMALVMGREGMPDEVMALGDKTPNYAVNLGSVHRVLPESRVVHILRDGRDVAVSALHHAYRVGLEQAIVPHSDEFYRQMRHHARRWAANVRAARSFGADHPELYCEVSYERMLVDAVPEISRVCEVLGVNADATVVAAAADAASFEKTTGRRRGEEDKSAFVRKGEAGDWQQYFDARSLAVFDEESDGLRHELGYA